nr:unnamed protein product [Callosobruchus chinensis]
MNFEISSWTVGVNPPLQCDSCGAPASGADDDLHDLGSSGCPETLSPAGGRHRAAHGPFASIPEDHALDDPPPLQPPSGGGGQRSRAGSRCASPAPSWDFSLEESSDSDNSNISNTKVLSSCDAYRTGQIFYLNGNIVINPLESEIERELALV